MSETLDPHRRPLKGFQFTTWNKVVLIFSLAHLLAALMNLPGHIWGDSAGYLPGDELAIHDGPLTGFEKFSLFGTDVVRPWTVTLPFGLLSTMDARAVFQTILSIVSFGILATITKNSFPNECAKGMFVGIFILVIGCSNEVLGWENEIGRESISISLLALFLASAIFHCQKPKMSSMIVMLAIGALALITRPSLGPVVIGLYSLAIFYLFYHRRKWMKIRYFGELIIVVALAISSIAYAAMVSNNIDQGWKKWYGITMTDVQIAYVMSDFNPNVQELKLSNQVLIPECILEDIPIDTSKDLGAPFFVPLMWAAECNDYGQWSSNNWNSQYYRHIVSNPKYSLNLMQEGFMNSVSPIYFSDKYSPVPLAISAMLFSRANVLDDPIIIYLAIVFVFSLLNSGKLLYWRKKSKSSNLLSIGIVLLVGSVASIWFNLVMLPTHAVDISRINTSGGLLLRSVIFVMATVVTWDFVRKLIQKDAQVKGQ